MAEARGNVFLPANANEFQETLRAILATLRNHPIAVVLVTSGCFGFVLGLLQPAWQVAVEGAQVVAGIVHYPQQNPFGVYQTKSWTLLHQIPALFLHFGASEISLSFFLSGLAGMLVFQALALCVFAVSGDTLLAVISPFLVNFARDVIYRGVAYPVMLMGLTHTYGMLALSFILLVLALIGVGQYRAGGLLLGLTLAVHPVMGFWCNLLVFICLIVDFQYLRPRFRGVAKYIILGYSLSAISLAFHLLVTYNILQVASTVASEYISTFVRYWDRHRHPFELFSSGIFFVILCLFMSLVWLLYLPRDVPRDSLFLLHSFVVAGLVGGVLSVSYWLPPEKVPHMLLTLMPARLLNLNILGCTALLLGLLGCYRTNFWVQVNLTTLTVMILWSSNFVSMTLLLTLSLLLLLLSVSRLHLPRLRLAALSESQRLRVALRGITFSVLGFIGLVTVIGSYSTWQVRKEVVFRDWTNDRLFAEASKGQGMLLTSSDLGLIQLRSRRPVLLDGHGLDAILYSPETGPEMNRILRQIYGVDLFNPPEEIKRILPGALLRRTGKVLWESRSLGQWRDIKAQFNVTDILTYRDWKLQLPEVIRNQVFVLYRIPD